MVSYRLLGNIECGHVADSRTYIMKVMKEKTYCTCLAAPFILPKYGNDIKSPLLRRWSYLVGGAHVLSYTRGRVKARQATGMSSDLVTPVLSLRNTRVPDPVSPGKSGLCRSGPSCPCDCGSVPSGFCHLQWILGILSTLTPVKPRLPGYHRCSETQELGHQEKDDICVLFP